jgi:hypothetical protein
MNRVICRQCGRAVGQVYGPIRGCHGCYQKWLGSDNKTVIKLRRYRRSLTLYRTNIKSLRKSIKKIEEENELLKKKLANLENLLI